MLGLGELADHFLERAGELQRHDVGARGHHVGDPQGLEGFRLIDDVDGAVLRRLLGPLVPVRAGVAAEADAQADQRIADALAPGGLVGCGIFSGHGRRQALGA